VYQPLKLALLLPVALVSASGQTPAPAKTEFEAASIRVNPPRTGFHFASESTASGGPGTADPGLFRCTGCSLATLISKAFDLRDYQFPGKSSLGDRTFDVMAKVPAGATPAEFRTMQQNLLKERFSLTFHFQEKSLRGYHLVIAKNGSKLHESDNTEHPKAPASGEQHGFGPGAGHAHEGLVAFGGTASFRGNHQTTADLARLLADQLSLPVDDQTGLTGSYDITLSWSGNNSHQGTHAEGAAFAGGGHGDHGGAGGGASGPGAGDTSGPTLFDALQAQLGLRLMPAAQTTARVLIIDHVEQLPVEN